MPAGEDPPGEAGGRIRGLERENLRLQRRVKQLQHNLEQLDKMSQATERVSTRLVSELREVNRRLAEEKKKVEERSVELASARAAAEQASRAKSSFLANMSHELRTPMNAIIGYAEMLAEEAEDKGEAQLVADLEKIRSAARHLLALINEVLDISKIEAGKMSLDIDTFLIPDVVRDVISTSEPLIEKNGNHLEVDIAEGVGSMKADQTKLRQALLNLVSNAAKFTSDGSIRVHVELDGEDRVVFQIEDSGIGMSGEQMSHLFEAFAQADASTTRRYGGTGLGLAISRSYCRLMGGDVLVDSVVGRGSCFTIRLPLEVSGAGGD